MVTIKPVRRALVPVDSPAAQRICSPNYDEFQSDLEITELLQQQPDSVLKITMPHCGPGSTGVPLTEGSDEALALAGEEMQALITSDLTRVVENALWIYEIVDPNRPDVRQIGLGGMARIDEIRTDTNPNGSIIRNEQVREYKAKGRADLIRATSAIIGTVNNAVDDLSGEFTKAIEGYADGRQCDLQAEKDAGALHKIWVIDDPEMCGHLAGLMAAEPHAYVADGNHRSAAAGMLGSKEFLTVFFPAGTMGLAPYNRLVNAPLIDPSTLQAQLDQTFSIEKLQADTFEPERIHEIGLYTNGVWFRLVPRADAYDPSNAVQSIDADIVQRNIFAAILGIDSATDERLTFVGGDRDAAYLKQRVDEGAANFAITLAPVTIGQFIAVCQQNRLMPPKSTWFQPKIRSGLVMALLD